MLESVRGEGVSKRDPDIGDSHVEIPLSKDSVSECLLEFDTFVNQSSKTASMLLKSIDSSFSSFLAHGDATEFNSSSGICRSSCCCSCVQACGSSIRAIDLFESIDSGSGILFMIDDSTTGTSVFTAEDQIILLSGFEYP